MSHSPLGEKETPRSKNLLVHSLSLLLARSMPWTSFPSCASSRSHPLPRGKYAQNSPQKIMSGKTWIFRGGQKPSLLARFESLPEPDPSGRQRKLRASTCLKVWPHLGPTRSRERCARAVLFSVCCNILAL